MHLITLGIDQSLSKCAMVLMEGSKPIKHYLIRTGDTKTKQSKGVLYFDTLEERIHHICVELKGIVLGSNPDNVVFESLSFGSTGDASRNLAGLYHAMRETLICMDYKGNVHTVTPTGLKAFARGFLPEDRQHEGKLATGKPKLIKMDKKLVVEAVKSKYGGEYLKGYNYSSGLDDLADATFLALYVQSGRINA